MKRLIFVLALVFSAAGAYAEESNISVEAKAGTGVEKRLPVGVTDTFSAKETVWIWTEVKGAAGSKIRHVWKLEGKEIWSTELAIGGPKWVTNSRRVVNAGNWVVEVMSLDGVKLAEVAFLVK